ncbi:DUF6879 family protein [Kitasatospora sp. NPDC003701]
MRAVPVRPPVPLGGIGIQRTVDIEQEQRQRHTGHPRREARSGTRDFSRPAGQQVRWLPRMQASDLALPGNDFWLLGGRLVRFGHFSGDGAYLGATFTDDPTVAALCNAAFEAAWERATQHEYEA